MIYIYDESLFHEVTCFDVLINLSRNYDNKSVNKESLIGPVSIATLSSKFYNVQYTMRQSSPPSLEEIGK